MSSCALTPAQHHSRDLSSFRTSVAPLLYSLQSTGRALPDSRRPAMRYHLRRSRRSRIFASFSISLVIIRTSVVILFGHKTKISWKAKLQLFSQYRSHLRDVQAPALPYLGIILTDIIFASDGNPDTRPSPTAPDQTLVNLSKFHSLAKIVVDFQRFQVPYQLAEVESLLGHLAKVRASDMADQSYS